MNHLDVALAARAFATGRAVRSATARHRRLAPGPLAVVLWQLGAEAFSAAAIGWGDARGRPHMSVAGEPRNRDLAFAALLEFARWFNPRFEGPAADRETFPRSGYTVTVARTAPQVVVVNRATVELLGRLGRRLAYLPTDGPRPADPALVRLGRHLRFLWDHAHVPGQQLVVALTDLMNAHWATPQSAAERESLPALDAYVEPPPGLAGFDAAAAAETCPVGPAPDGADDERLMPLVERFNRDRKGGIAPAVVRPLLAPIVGHYRPLLRRAWDLLWRCRDREAALPEARSVGRRWDADRDAYTRHIDWLAGPGLRRTRHTPRQAAMTLRNLEEAGRLVGAEEACDDPLRMAAYVLTNRAVRGTVVAVDPTHKEPGPKRMVCRPLVTLRSPDPCLIPAGRELWWAEQPEGKAFAVERVLAACCRGLASARPTPISPTGKFSLATLAEGEAFARVVESAGRAAWLTPVLVRRWLPTALFARMSGNWAAPITACDAVSAADTEEALLDTIAFWARYDGSPFVLRMIPQENWTDRMTTRLVELVGDERVRPASRRELLEHLAVRSADRADPVAVDWAARPVSSDDTDQLRQAGRNLLLARDPASALDLIEPDFEARGAPALEELRYLWEHLRLTAGQEAGWPFPLLERLGTLLLRAYPVASDPKYSGGRVPPDRELRDLRNHLVTALLDSSDEEASGLLDRLGARDAHVRDWVQTHRANRRAAEFLPGVAPSTARDPAAPSVSEAVRLLERGGFRLIRSPDDLLDAVTESLRRVQGDIGLDLPMLYSAPDRNGLRRHLHEDALQAYLRRRLSDDLPRIADGVQVQIVREDQIAFRQRLDLRVTAPCHGGGLATVVVEVKWSTNSETRSGLVQQLGARYLLGEGLAHGVFLVGWSGEWRPGDGNGPQTDRATLDVHLTSQRDAYCRPGQPGAGLRITPLVLDANWARPGS